MYKLLSSVLFWIIRKMGTLILVLAFLVSGTWLMGKWKTSEQLRTESVALAGNRADVIKQLEQKKSALLKLTENKYQAIRQKIGNLKSFLEQRRQERKALAEKFPWKKEIPFTDPNTTIAALDIIIRQTQDAITVEERLSASAEKSLKSLRENITPTNAEIEKIDRRLADIQEEVSKDFLYRSKSIIYTHFFPALWILLGIIFVPIGIKLIFYFVIAPYAAGRAPIRLLPATSGHIFSPTPGGTAVNDKGKMSAVSQAIVLGADEELLIQPEYLQSTTLRARKTSKWFLNVSIPFSSVLSGMFMLTRVGPSGSEPVVISATKDPLGEVGLIELTDGAAFVCQPRSLAGVIQDRRNPIRITRHWRVGNLQSWLTLQLRFLVFHGPGQLVVKGCRGVRIESAGSGRLINQNATLGFSANLDYANTRCETFLSYWTGREDLFNDVFRGESGVYVYEEMPDLKRTAGIAGRGLEGISDAALKVFGL